MKDETQYKIKDLYGKFEDLKTTMNVGFENMERKQEQSMKRIEDKLDKFISAQAEREARQDGDIGDLKTKAAVQETKQGMIAGGLTIFTSITSLLAYYLPKFQK